MAVCCARWWGKTSVGPVGGHLGSLWVTLGQPLLFALVGAEVDLDFLDGKLVAKGTRQMAPSWIEAVSSACSWLTPNLPLAYS